MEQHAHRPRLQVVRTFRRLLGLTAVVLVAALAAACAEVANRASVYEEPIPAAGLSPDRSYAIRVTLFEYERDVGGFIEFYPIDGTTNSPINPYFAPEACAYFGAGRIENDEFPIEVLGPTGGFLMRASLLDRGRRMTGRVVSGGGVFEPVDGVLAIEFERVPNRPVRQCDVSAYGTDPQKTSPHNSN